MLRILNEDGFEIKERELMRVRAKNRWLLRVPNGMKRGGSAGGKREVEDSGGMVGGAGVQGDLDGGMLGHNGGVDEAAPDGEEGTPSEGKNEAVPIIGADSDTEGLAPEVLQKKAERLQKLQAESEIRWQNRKRRRRTRGWAGLPADPPGPPRFPSETTIDESKAFLSLDPAMYREIRQKFHIICEEADVIKKTLAGPERWEAVKSRLIQESPHLQRVFWQETDNLEQKKLALDVVCTDVTKRMRTLERRMTIAEAKNTLGINPEESRQIRNAFYATLKADHFTSKLEAGPEHWEELKMRWIEGSELLTGILEPGESDPAHKEKVRALEVLCRDVMKRLRDDQAKKDPGGRKRRVESLSFASETASMSLRDGEKGSFSSVHSAELNHGQDGQPADNLTQSQQQHHQRSLGDYAQQAEQHVQSEAQQQQQREHQLQQNLHQPSLQQQQHQTQHHELGSYPISSPHEALVQAAAHAQAQAQAQAEAEAQAQAEAHAQAQAHAHAQAQAQMQQHMARHSQSHMMLSEHDDMRIDPSLLLATAADPGLLDGDGQGYGDGGYDGQGYADHNPGAGGYPQAVNMHSPLNTHQSLGHPPHHAQHQMQPHSQHQLQNHADMQSPMQNAHQLPHGVPIPLQNQGMVAIGVSHAMNMASHTPQVQHSPLIQHSPFQSHTPLSHLPGPVAAPSPMAIYFRLSPTSDVSLPNSTSRLWVSTLTSLSVAELRDLAVQKFPGGVLMRLDGVVKNGSGMEGGEMTIQIDQDEELEAYLSAIGGVKPVFVVEVVQGWKGE
jgi:hypothetical protein